MMTTINPVAAPNTQGTANHTPPFTIKTLERPVRYSEEFKMRVVREFLGGEKKRAVAEKYGIPVTTVDSFVRKYRFEVQKDMEQHGEFVRSYAKLRTYDDAIRKQCVCAVLSGKSIKMVANTFGIPADTIKNWMYRYSDRVAMELDDQPAYTLTSGPSPVEIRPEDPAPAPQEEDILRRNAQLEEENRILRKVVAIFATAV